MDIIPELFDQFPQFGGGIIVGTVVGVLVGYFLADDPKSPWGEIWTAGGLGAFFGAFLSACYVASGP